MQSHWGPSIWPKRESGTGQSLVGKGGGGGGGRETNAQKETTKSSQGQVEYRKGGGGFQAFVACPPHPSRRSNSCHTDFPLVLQ